MLDSDKQERIFLKYNKIYLLHDIVVDIINKCHFLLYFPTGITDGRQTKAWSQWSQSYVWLSIVWRPQVKPVSNITGILNRDTRNDIPMIYIAYPTQILWSKYDTYIDVTTVLCYHSYHSDKSCSKNVTVLLLIIYLVYQIILYTQSIRDVSYFYVI